MKKGLSSQFPERCLVQWQLQVLWQPAAVPVHPLRLLPAQHLPALQQVPQQPVRTSLHLWATSP